MTTPHKSMLIQARDALTDDTFDRDTRGGRALLASLQAAVDAPEPEPEPEPVAYYSDDWKIIVERKAARWWPDAKNPLYTHLPPPAVREPLTDAEIIELAKDAGFDTRTFARANTMVVVRHSNGSWVDITEALGIFVRAIEAAHGIKS